MEEADCRKNPLKFYNSKGFWYAQHDLPLRGINFEPYRAIKMPIPDGKMRLGQIDSPYACTVKSASRMHPVVQTSAHLPQPVHLA